MEHDFITQQQFVPILAKEYPQQIETLYPVSFRAVAITKEKFDIIAINMSTNVGPTISIRWWAIPARETAPRRWSTPELVGTIRRTSEGERAFNNMTTELRIPEAEASDVVSNMYKNISVAPSGMTATNIGKSINVKEETVTPMLSALVKEGKLKTTGTGANKRYMVVQ